MDCFRSAKFVNITLFFFYWMALFPSAYADGLSGRSDVTSQQHLTIPTDSKIYYVTQEQAAHLERELPLKGYAVQRLIPAEQAEVHTEAGSAGRTFVAQTSQPRISLAESLESPPGVSLADSTTAAAPDVTSAPGSEPASESESKSVQANKPNRECPPEIQKQTDSTTDDTSTKVSTSTSEKGNTENPAAEAATTPLCSEPTTTETSESENSVSTQEADSQPEPVSDAPHTHRSGSIHIHGEAVNPPLPKPLVPDLKLPDLGNADEAAIILFVVVGIVVVAVLVVYAIKGLISAISAEDKHYSWSLGLQSDLLATDKGEHGRFFGIKLSTGYIAEKALYIGLAGELGFMDINLDVAQGKSTTRLRLAGNYWMLGAEMRLGNFSQAQDGISNANYMFLEFMGGTSEYAATDVIGSAKLGWNFRLFDSARMGLNVGSRYIGLNEDEGFVNSRDNYWLNYGMELEYRF